MTLVMGIVNVTPDSFSDGGRYLDHATAVRHARAMLAGGASIIDVGGESTRPGAARVDVEEELERVVPIVRDLAADGVTVSVDTMRAAVARAAIEAGARIINDVSGGQADQDMLPVVADSTADLVVMHWRGHSDTMQQAARYDDVVGEVVGELIGRRDAALAAGVDAERIILDPGLGFAKSWDHNWALLRRLDELQRLGHRVLVGASRKAFLGELLGGREPADRDGATAALSFWAGLHEVWAVRTHDVRHQADAIAVARRLLREPRSTSTARRASEVGPVSETATSPTSAPAGCGSVRSAEGRPAIDQITLTGLTATGYHGVFPAERREGQPFVVDVVLELALDTESDDLGNTVNYAEVADEVEAVVTGQPYNLIETVAGQIAERCLARGKVEGVTVTVHKPRAPLTQTFADVSVTISRRRHV